MAVSDHVVAAVFVAVAPVFVAVAVVSTTACVHNSNGKNSQLVLGNITQWKLAYGCCLCLFLSLLLPLAPTAPPPPPPTATTTTTTTTTNNKTITHRAHACC